MRALAGTALETDPGNAEAVKYLAFMHITLGQRQDAIKLLDTFLLKYSNAYPALEAFAEMILGSGKTYSEMKDLLAAFRRTEFYDLPTDRLKFFLAETLFHTGHTDEARAIFRALPPERYNQHYRNILESTPSVVAPITGVLKSALQMDFAQLITEFSSVIAPIKPGSNEEEKLRTVIGRFESLPEVRAITDKHVTADVVGNTEHLKKARSIETFLYSGEQDMLHLHLQATKSFIDHYIIIQGNRTFTGAHKSLDDVFEDDRIQEFRERITLLNVSFRDFGCQYFVYPWFVEALHRNAAQRFIGGFSIDTVHILADVDEILRHDTIEKFKALNQPSVTCRLRDHRIFMNFRRMPTPQNPLAGMPDMTVLATGKIHAALDAFTIRVVYARQRHFQWNSIKDAGWHFSSVGTPAEIKKKYMNYSHTENRISSLGEDFYMDLVSAAKGDSSAIAKVGPLAASFLKLEHFTVMPLTEPDYPSALVNNPDFSHLVIPS